jgi:hypothetical protein
MKIRMTIFSTILCAAFATGAVAADKPNILFIMSDDDGNYSIENRVLTS